MQIRRFIPLFFVEKILIGSYRTGLRWPEALAGSPFPAIQGGSERGLALGALATLWGALALGLLISAKPRVRADGPVARDEADDYAADHQSGDAEAQDPTQDSRLR